MRSIATPAVKNSDLHIQYQCPQCGAPATLRESDRLFTCGYCRVKSYIMTQGVAQYHLPHKAPASRDLIYFPYWRFKGMLFSCQPDGVQAQFIDTSHQACPSTRFPVSLGLRTQALTLGLVTAQTPGYFITPQTSLKAAMAIFGRRFNHSRSHALLHQAHIGETVSVIYAPFYRDHGLVDAVLNRPLPQDPQAPWEPAEFPGGPARTRFQFIPNLCPHCGWDLEGARDAQVLSCPNCRTLWQPRRTGFSAVPCVCAPADFPEPVYLPFWRIRAEVSGVALDSYADLVRLANLPKAVQTAWEAAPFHFWAPAFKVRPRVFLRLMQLLTTSLPADHLENRFPDRTRLSPNLPVDEAAETLRTTLAGLVRPLERMAELLPRIAIKPRKALLVYLPFEDRLQELVSPALNLAVNKNQLTLARNL
jgi:DNA-directed RNA polymerase subunit RPC12/RpoP